TKDKIMKATRLELITLCMVTALGAQLSLAQQSDQTPSQSSGLNSSSQTSGSTAGGIPLSKLKGATVKSNNGDKLGKVEDIIIDPQTGKATFAIIGKGGVLNLGEKRMPVPWQALTIDSQKQFTLNMDKEKLRSAPTVNSDYSDLN